MRERDVEKYLHNEVTNWGGTTRKFVSPQHPNVPDRIVIWPKRMDFGKGLVTKIDAATVHFVECKAPGKTARPGQAREHVRLQKLGCVVLVIDTIEKVDNYVTRNK